MSATGKHRRAVTGKNRHQLHHDQHTKKSAAKILRAGWARPKNKKHAKG
jgi:hypothetical protein